MKYVVCLCFVLVSIQVKIPWVFSKPAGNEPDTTNMMCLPEGESAHLLQYNKLEIVNNLNKHSLADLVNGRGKMPEDNPLFNKFIHCVWKKNMFLNSNDEIEYKYLERVITEAIVRVVGNSGPAMILSMREAKNIVDECKRIKDVNPEMKVAKVQNMIIDKLQPFADL